MDGLLMPENAQQLYQRLLTNHNVIVLGDSQHGSDNINSHLASMIPSMRASGVTTLALEMPRSGHGHNIQQLIDDYTTACRTAHNSGRDMSTVPLPLIFSFAPRTPGGPREPNPTVMPLVQVIQQCARNNIRVLCADVPSEEAEATPSDPLGGLGSLLGGGGGNNDAFERARARADASMVSYITSNTTATDKVVFMVGSAHSLISTDRQRLGETRNVIDHFTSAGRTPANILLLEDADRVPLTERTIPGRNPNFTVRVPTGTVTAVAPLSNSGPTTTPSTTLTAPAPSNTGQPQPQTDNTQPQAQPVISSGSSSEAASAPWYVRYMPIGLAALGGIGGLALGGGFSLTGVLLAIGLAIAGGVGGLFGAGAVSRNNNNTVPSVRIQPGQNCKVVRGNDGQTYCDVQATVGNEQRTVRLLGDVSLNTGSSNGTPTHSFAFNRFMIPGMNNNVPFHPPGLIASFFRLSGQNQDTLAIDAEMASRIEDNLNVGVRTEATNISSVQHPNNLHYVYANYGGKRYRLQGSYNENSRIMQIHNVAEMVGNTATVVATFKEDKRPEIPSFLGMIDDRDAIHVQSVLRRMNDPALLVPPPGTGNGNAQSRVTPALDIGGAQNSYVSLPPPDHVTTLPDTSPSGIPLIPGSAARTA